MINVNLSDGLPVLIPCQPPRDWALYLPIGAACTCPGTVDPAGLVPGHFKDCPCIPVRVDVTLTGATWEEVKVLDVEPSGRTTEVVERLGLVAALLCEGRQLQWIATSTWSPPGLPGLVAQRDAVFADLTAASTHEEGLYAAVRRLPLEVGIAALCPVTKRFDFAAGALGRYVELLLEQIGSLP